MLILTAQQDTGSVRISLTEGVKKVPGLVAGVIPYVVLFGVPAIWRDPVRIAAVASLLTGFKHDPLRESILILDGQTGERLAHVEKV